MAKYYECSKPVRVDHFPVALGFFPLSCKKNVQLDLPKGKKQKLKMRKLIKK